MRLTTFSDYTLRTLIYLALRPNELCAIDEIAAAYGISASHLMKVVHQAAQAGEVQDNPWPPWRIAARAGPGDDQSRNGGAPHGTRPAHRALFRRRRRVWHPARLRAAGGAGDALAAFVAVQDRLSLADPIRPKRQLSALLGLDHAAQECIC